MAYSESSNIAAPSNWDAANSGYVPEKEDDWQLADFLAAKTYGLADLWDGEKYVIPDVNAGGTLFFTFPELLSITEFNIHADLGLNPYDPSSVSFFQSNGDLFADGTLISTNYNEPLEFLNPEETELLITFGTYDALDVFTPIALAGVKSFMISGNSGYPQGAPYILYGISLGGTTVAPFWTGFNSNADVWPYKQRMAELF